MKRGVLILSLLSAILSALLSSLFTTAIAEGPLRFGPPYLLQGNFKLPFGVALDVSSNPPRLVVADTTNKAIKWADATDLTKPLTFNAVAANLVDPEAIAVDANGNLYVVNTLGNDVRKFTWNGNTYAGGSVFCGGQSPSGVDILLPRDVAVDKNGAVYLLDTGNNRILKAPGPSATTWVQLVEDKTWATPYGLAVGDDLRIYVTDTGNHRIVRLDPQGNRIDAIGKFGTEHECFRFPRDVAVDKDGRMYVADTYNHRIHLIDPTGQTLIYLGQAPGVGTLEKIIVDSSYRIFAADSDNGWVLAFLGLKTPKPFELYVRDNAKDDGTEPSDATLAIDSPDVVVRNKPDVDITYARQQGLRNAYLSQDPHFGVPNYVYLEMHNKGAQAAYANSAKFYWYDPTIYNADPNAPKGAFPADWHGDGFYSAYVDDHFNSPSNVLFVPYVPAGGSAIVGPLIWLPPNPKSANKPGVFRLALRAANPFDAPPGGNARNLIRASNKASEVPVTVRTGPIAIGNQNTLLIPVNFAKNSPLTLSALNAVGAQMNAWLREVSYGQTSVTVRVHDPYIPVNADPNFYNDVLNNPVIELTEEALTNLLQKEPDLLDAANGKQITRVFLVTNDGGQNEWATTEPWPFTANQILLTASVLSATQTSARFNHAMAHHFGLVDLYGHDPPFHFNLDPVGSWDTMGAFNDAHPLVWNKELASWVSSNQAQIAFVPRPAAGMESKPPPIDLFKQEAAAAKQTIGIAIGLTPGVTSLNNETLFYFVEARERVGVDATALAQNSEGVLVYYVDKTVPQGQGPVIVQDFTPGTPTIADAAIPSGANMSLPQAGLSVAVTSPGANGADYQISLDYKPPAQSYDVYLEVGPVSWESPAIFVDVPDTSGAGMGKYQSDGDPDPDHAVDQGEAAIQGIENHVYAKIQNKPMGVAADQLIVRFSFSEPDHSIGGVQAFDYYGFAPVKGPVQPGGFRQVMIPWKPKFAAHTCTRAELAGPGVLQDVVLSDNAVVHNYDVEQATTHSPYTSVEFPFVLANDESVPRLVYYRADGIPKGWAWSFKPAKALLGPGQTAQGILSIQPPTDAPVCTSHSIKVTSWEPRGDTLVRLGGTTLQIDLRNKSELTLQAEAGRCEVVDRRKKTRARPGRTSSMRDEPCKRIVASGCTNPKEANEIITLQYTGPDGEPIYHAVKTDENGCYKDSLVVHEGMQWQVKAGFKGTTCDSTSHVESSVDTLLPTQDHPERDDPNPLSRVCIVTASENLSGLAVPLDKRTESGCGGETTKLDRSVHLRVTSNDTLEPTETAVLDGELEIVDLGSVEMSKPPNAGIETGRFRWRGRDMEAVGWIRGVQNIFIQWPPGTPQSNEPERKPNHFELSLDGTIIRGAQVGAHLHAVLGLDGESRDKGSRLTGTLKAILETVCDPQADAEIADRVRRALADDERVRTDQCSTNSCLAELTMTGEGIFSLDAQVEDRCKSAECTCTKTWNGVAFTMMDRGGHSFLNDGILEVRSLGQLFDKEPSGQGEHAGQFGFTAKDGSRIEGTMVGISLGGTHGREDKGAVLEGRLAGQIVAGPKKGARVEARYAIQLSPDLGFKQQATITLSGFVVDGCDK